MIASHIHSFTAYLSYEKHFSQHTIKAYQRDLEQFGDYVLKEFEVSKIEPVNHQMIRAFLAYLMNEQVTPRTVSRKLSSLKSFYKFLMKEGVVANNPLSRIQPPKVSKRLPVFVEETDMERLFDYRIETEPDNGEETNGLFSDNYEGARDRLMLLLFYSCGVRLSELIGLKTVDIDFKRQTLKVLGKRNKERIIPITAELKQELQSFIAAQAAEGIVSEYIFTTPKGEPVYPKLVYGIVKRFLSKITTIEKRSPHVLRHTFATHLLNKGADLNAIKELMGHASLAATQVYTHNSIERLKNVYKLKHPRA